MHSEAEPLAEPDVELAGFRLWVHGRPFERAESGGDASWLEVRVQCQAEGASVWIEGPLLQTADLASCLRQVEELHRTLRGMARLQSLESELSLALSAGSRGEISMLVEITPDVLNQTHSFRFDIDQSYLLDLIHNLRSLLRRLDTGPRPNPAFQRMPGPAETRDERPAQPGTAEREDR